MPKVQTGAALKTSMRLAADMDRSTRAAWQRMAILSPIQVRLKFDLARGQTRFGTGL